MSAEEQDGCRAVRGAPHSRTLPEKHANNALKRSTRNFARLAFALEADHALDQREDGVVFSKPTPPGLEVVPR